jgi:hypothetical protein
VLAEAKIQDISRSYLGNVIRAFAKIKPESSFILETYDDDGAHKEEILAGTVEFEKDWIGRE